MGFEKAKQSLSSIEEKLRRAFSLAGTIGASLEPVVQPVIIAGDLRDPGHTPFSGRCFAIADMQGVAVGVNVMSFIFGARVLIESLYIDSNTANHRLDAYITTPTETAPISAGAAAVGAWRDRTVAADVPPIISVAAFGALVGVASAPSNRIATWRAGNGGNPVRPVTAMIEAGGTLTFRSDQAATNVAWTILGRIWP